MSTFVILTSFICLTANGLLFENDEQLTQMIKQAETPDPSCQLGVCSGPVCCPAECGTCGGPQCLSLNPDLGHRCCAGWIRAQNRSCSKYAAPCRVDASFKCGQIKAGNVGKWENIDEMLKRRPTKRHEACFIMVRGKGFLIGGRGNGKTVDIFDPVKRRWKSGASMPQSIHHMQCVSYRNKIYIPTSWYGGSPTEEVHDKMFMYNIATDSWSSLEGLPEDRRRGSAASVVYRKKIWVIGGNIGGHWPPSKTLGWLDYYDLETGVWVTNLPDLPEGRDHSGAAVVNGKICIAGGRDGGSELRFAATIRSTYCYDAKTEKWTDMKAPIPVGRAGAATATMCDGRMMVAGGEGRFRKAFDRVDVFDGTSWETLAPLQRARHGTGLAVSSCKRCGHIFIASGSGARGGTPELNSTERYIPSGVQPTCRFY